MIRHIRILQKKNPGINKRITYNIYLVSYIIRLINISFFYHLCILSFFKKLISKSSIKT